MTDLPPESVDTSECGVDGCFAQTVLKVHGRVITERAVEPLSVVEDLDVPEDFAFRFGARGEDPILNEFAFERGPEALHPGVVVAVARPAHAGHHAVAAQQLAVRLAGVLAAAVRVVEQPW